MEEKHITNHSHQHKQRQPEGIETHHTKDPHHVWICPRCGWTYPNPHPSAKHRRNHRKHCGEMEGFKVISSVGRETQGGSSDDELSDDENKSTGHKKLSFHKDNNFVLQTNLSAPTSYNNSRNLDMSSSEADIGVSALKVGASDNVTLDSSQTIVPDAKASNFSPSGETSKEALEEATATTIGLGVHGLNVPSPIELSNSSTGPDMLGFKHESNSFLKEVPDTYISQDASVSIEHQEFPVKVHQKVLDYAEMKIQNNQTDNRVLPVPGGSILPVVQSHPSSANVVDGLGSQTMNETIKDQPKISKEKQHISEDVKISFAKLQNPGHIEPPQTFGKSATSPTHPVIHHNFGISSRKVGIASILSFKETSSDDLNANFSPVEGTPAFADKKIYELSPTKDQFSDRKTQEVSISETKEQEMQRDVACPSDYLEGLGTKESSGADSQKENPQSLTLEPKTEKLPQLALSAISIDLNSANNLHLQVTEGVLYSQEKNRIVAQGILDKTEDYTKSKHASPMNGDSESYREGEQSPNFDDTNSDDMLSLEMDNEMVTVARSTLPKLEAVKETEAPCSKDIEKISGQEINLQASIKVLNPDQDMSCADGFPTEYSKAGEKQKAENSTFTDSNIIEHNMNGSDPDGEKEDSTEQHFTFSDVGMAKHGDSNIIALERLPKTPSIEVVVDEKSAASETTQPECVNYSHEEKITVEQDIFVKPGDYIESTNNSPSICVDSGSHVYDEKPENFNHTTFDGMLLHEEDKEKIIGDTLSKQEAVKETIETKEICTKAFETTSGQKLDAHASGVVIPDPEISCTESPTTENSKAGKRQVVECRTFTNSSVIEHEMKDYSPDCTKEDSTQGTVTLPELDINSAAKVIALEMLPETIFNEVIDGNSAVSESHQPECMVYTEEKRSTVEQAISVKPGDYIETKHISLINGDSDSHRDEKPQNSNVTNADDLHPKADKTMIIGTDLSKHESLNKAKETFSEGIETTLDQQLDLLSSGELVIPDQGISLTDSPLINDLKSGETQQAEFSGFTNSSIVQHDLRDCDPDGQNKYSIQENTVLPDVDMDKDIDANITPLENLPKAAPNEVVDCNSAVLESFQPKAKDTHSSFQGDTHRVLEAEIPREESDHEGNEKGLQHSVMEQSDQLQVGVFFINTSCSATITTVDSSSHLNGSIDNRENSSKESMDDVHGCKSKLMKTYESALWEQLLETNANESINQDTYQDIGNSGTSPGNPFIHEKKLSSSEGIPKNFGIEGRHGLISEKLNTSAEVENTLPPISKGVEKDPIISSGNKGGCDVEAIHSKENTSETSLIVPENVFEAPSFMTLVESGNHSERHLTHNEIEPKVRERSDGELRADAEMDSGRHERLHIPLRNLLAKENMRGTQNQSTPDPLLVDQPQQSSQKTIHGVYASAVEVSDEDGTSSQKLTLVQKDSNSCSQKLAEKVWNSPARLPSPKVEKQKVSKVKSAWTMCLCGSDVK